jgi:hypothetical protein
MQDISLLNLLELSETTMIRLARLIQEDPIMARLKLKIGVYKDELSFMEQKFHRITGHAMRTHALPKVRRLPFFLSPAAQKDSEPWFPMTGHT